MAKITEIAPDVYRISILTPEINLQFNHFLLKDDEPLLFHAGYRRFFPELREAVARLIDPTQLRWVSFSHFEGDECGALNLWLETAPQAQAASNFLGAILNLNDFAVREPRILQPGEALATGKHRFRFVSTAHIPHGWDAGVLFEETRQTLFCSDLFHHFGDVEPLTTSDIVGRARQTLLDMQNGPFAYYFPYTPQTDRIFESLAALEPKTLATMHGSSFTGNGAQALRDLAMAVKETCK